MPMVKLSGICGTPAGWMVANLAATSLVKSMAVPVSARVSRGSWAQSEVSGEVLRLFDTRLGPWSCSDLGAARQPRDHRNKFLGLEWVAEERVESSIADLVSLSRRNA